MAHTFKQKIGALVLDWPRFEWALRTGWFKATNRNECTQTSPDGQGLACAWQWTSDLHVAKVFPSTGTRLMKRATGDWPISFADALPNGVGDVQVTFVIGHRGMERVAQLLATLATIAAQRGVGCECIVVEQSSTSAVRDLLPHWIRYVHTPLPVPDMPYCRSWTLNVGARLAKGKVIVFHDNDMLVPDAYAAELWRRHEEGFEVINLKRFIFYLSERQSTEIQSTRRVEFDLPPDTVVQNLEAGGSLAVDRDAFFALGGYDEAFVGWGGEDNEFWERAQTRKVWPYAYLPIVHLWHPAQPRKQDPANPNSRLQAERTALAPEQRIRELAARPFGDPASLSVDWPAPRST
jgi:hypothetical protein